VTRPANRMILHCRQNSGGAAWGHRYTHTAKC